REAKDETVLSSSIPVYQPETRIHVAHESCRDYLGHGWYAPDRHSRWSMQEAAIKFRLEQVQPLRLRMMATTFSNQRIVVHLNGRTIGTLHSPGGPLRLMELPIPPDALQNSNTLTFALPEARAPKSAGEGDDDRILGFRVVWMKLTP